MYAFYLTESIRSVNYKAQSINAVKENNHCLGK